MSVLTDAISGLAGTLKQVAGESCSLTRQGATLLDSLTSVPDLVAYEVIDEQGFMTSVSSYDWLFTAADLASLSPAVRPGDRIVATVGGVLSQFEVMPIGSRPCVEPAEPDGILLIVHTKRVST